jgi:type II secretion system protein G
MLKKTFARGFTLIELMVVIAIIGLLATIITISMIQTRRDATYARAQADERTMETALELYYDTNGDWPPAGGNMQANSDDSTWQTLATYLQPFLGQIPKPDYVPDTTFPYSQNYIYQKATAANPLTIKIIDGHTGAFITCLTLRGGYYLDFIAAQQMDSNKNDGGLDPDGVDYLGGSYSTSQTGC